ncbi:ATP-binding protein, partial [Planktothrix sp. FACHB-1355]|uniref:ATP-binding protein n=1 Tax=Planktothrix sp. FACHB-1355 TaxID=2692854 RepID=UPI00168C0312
MSDINWGLIRNGYTFQDLICSLIRLEDHKARLYVRPGKDYAQDARSGDGRIIYQMKFHRNEAASSAIADAKEEAKNITKYLVTPGKSQEIWQVVQEWILISNVAFNPSDELKWNKEVKPLFDELELKASYWEKSVIETLLLKYPDLKQAYFGGETRVFLGIAEAREQVQQSQEFEHYHALDTHFQGRETELEQYKNFINDAKKKILVIHGAGGIGKTRFLLEGAETQALPEGWQILWANIATMTATSSWFIGLIVERPTLLLIDEPEDATVLKTLVEQISGGRARTWKVAIAVQSPNDPVLKYLQGTRMQDIVEDLPLTSLEEKAAIAFCQELIEFGSLQSQTNDWKTQAATWIAQHYDYYPIWIAIAVKLLESRGNLEIMPQEAESLASDYLEGILTQQQSIPSEKALNLLQWTALFDTVNREDTTVIHFIQAKVGCRNPTELQRYFDSLIARKVIFERGSRNRLLKIKPDVLADYILRQWLTYSRPSGANLEASSEALEIIEEVNAMLDSAEASSLQKLLLRGIARFELLQQLSNNPINLLGRLLHDWYDRVPTMNARRKLAYLSVLDEISFAHVSEVLSLLTAVLNSTSAPETVSTIFGQRIITHDDVILALPWIVYHTAPYAQTPNEQMALLSLLCKLVIAERDVATRRPQGLPNDGKRAETVLPRVIKGSPEFRSDFEESAFEKANELLTNIRSQIISEDQKLILDTLVKPLLDIEQEYTSFDGRFVKTQTWLITPETTKWKIRESLRTTIKEILREKKIHPTQSVILWQLLAYAHQEINQALLEFSRDSSPTTPYYEAFRNVIIEDLQWMVEFLKLGNFDIEELAAARELWKWYAQFSKDNELKEIANQCETSFKERELFPKYAPLLTWESNEALGQWAVETSHNLANSDNPQIIHDFVRDGVKILGKPDAVSRLLIVAANLGLKAQQSQSVRNFVQEALKLPVKDAEFLFAARL